MSFGRASKYVIWSGIEIRSLVGHRNMSFGGASKYVIWWGIEICHLVGRRNMSFGGASKYVIWSGDKICHLVGSRNVTFLWRISMTALTDLTIIFGHDPLPNDDIPYPTGGQTNAEWSA